MKFKPIFVRPAVWWNSKIPLSIFLFLFLINGKTLSESVLPLIGLILVVCAVGNFGYAVNDLYDQEEDQRANKPNATQAMGITWMRIVIASSAGLALVCSFLSGGWLSVGLVILALVLPLTYSVPPLRLKERYWAGALADGLAAHVFPAMLALVIVDHQQLAAPSPLLIAVLFIWSFATGMRGILTHQLKNAEMDKDAGLLTAAHQIGYLRLKGLIQYGLAPIEFLSISVALIIIPFTPFAIAMCLIFLGLETIKTVQNVVPCRALSHDAHRYIPFLNSHWYLIWGPLVFALDAAITDPAFLMCAMLFVSLFSTQCKHEFHHIRLTLRSIIESLNGSRN